MSCQRVTQSIWRCVPYPDQCFNLKWPCSQNFMLIDPHIQILNQMSCNVMSFRVMSCQRVAQYFWRSVPYPDRFFTSKYPCRQNFMLIDPRIQILAKSCHVMSEGHPVNLEMCSLSRSMFQLKITLYTKIHVDRHSHSDFSQMSCQRVT